MERTSVQKLAKILLVLLTIVFVVNIVVLFLVPGLVGIRNEGGYGALLYMRDELPPLPLFFLACWQYFWRVWRVPHMAVLTVFLWVCGVCSALILRQGRRVLKTVEKGEPFCFANADSFHRSAAYCFVVFAAALARLIWGLIYYRSTAPLVTYNALFVPAALVAGLLCMVISALFRQAAELKEDSDLTI